MTGATTTAILTRSMPNPFHKTLCSILRSECRNHFLFLFPLDLKMPPSA